MRDNNCEFESSIIGAIVEDNIKLTTTNPTPGKFISLIIKTQSLVNLVCQKITAYYDGIFEDPNSSSINFKGQFRITVDINLHDKKIYAKFDDYNKNFTKGYLFGIEISNGFSVE